jgi:hypothetical protein
VTTPIPNVLAVAIENARWSAPTIAGTNGSTSHATSAGSEREEAPRSVADAGERLDPTPVRQGLADLRRDPGRPERRGSSFVIDVAKTSR